MTREELLKAVRDRLAALGITVTNEKILAMANLFVTEIFSADDVSDPYRTKRYPTEEDITALTDSFLETFLTGQQLQGKSQIILDAIESAFRTDFSGFTPPNAGPEDPIGQVRAAAIALSPDNTPELVDAEINRMRAANPDMSDVELANTLARQWLGGPLFEDTGEDREDQRVLVMNRLLDAGVITRDADRVEANAVLEDVLPMVMTDLRILRATPGLEDATFQDALDHFMPSGGALPPEIISYLTKRAEAVEETRRKEITDRLVAENKAEADRRAAIAAQAQADATAQQRARGKQDDFQRTIVQDIENPEARFLETLRAFGVITDDTPPEAVDFFLTDKLPELMKAYTDLLKNKGLGTGDIPAQYAPRNFFSQYVQENIDAFKTITAGVPTSQRAIQADIEDLDGVFIRELREAGLINDATPTAYIDYLVEQQFPKLQDAYQKAFQRGAVGKDAVPENLAPAAFFQNYIAQNQRSFSFDGGFADFEQQTNVDRPPSPTGLATSEQTPQTTNTIRSPSLQEYVDIVASLGVDTSFTDYLLGDEARRLAADLQRKDFEESQESVFKTVYSDKFGEDITKKLKEEGTQAVSPFPGTKAVSKDQLTGTQQEFSDTLLQAQIVTGSTPRLSFAGALKKFQPQLRAAFEKSPGRQLQQAQTKSREKKRDFSSAFRNTYGRGRI